MSRRDNDYVPKSYDDLYAFYVEADDSLASNCIRKMTKGFVREEELTNLRHDAFLKMLRHRMLEKFDPAKGNFGGIVYVSCRSVVSNWLRKKAQEPADGLSAGSLIESNGSEEETFEPGIYCLDHIFTRNTSYDEVLDARALIGKLFEWARGLAQNPRSKRDESLIRVLEMMSEEFKPRDMAPHLGVATSTVFNWVAVIREKACDLRGDVSQKVVL